MIQGGSPDNDIMTDSDWHIKGEFEENGIPNPVRHIRGAISMARDDGYDTAGTQFFVVHQDAEKLNEAQNGVNRIHEENLAEVEKHVCEACERVDVPGMK